MSGFLLPAGGETGSMGAQGATGPTGPMGATGARGSLTGIATGVWFDNNGSQFGEYQTINFVNNIFGAAGATGVNVSVTGIPTGTWAWNNGATVGQFGTYNLVGGLAASTGPAVGQVNITPLGQFYQGQVTGHGFASTASNTWISTGLVCWGGQQLVIGNNMNATTVGATAAGQIYFSQGGLNSAYGYYEIETRLQFTGISSGSYNITLAQYDGATGINPAGATSILQSAALGNIGTGFGTSINNSYVAAIASGSYLSTWITFVGANSPSGLYLSPTGTSISIQQIG
jgi:collagen type I alpha